ncbi:MAG: extracellular solute-binding protein [Pseudomonadota bacterium]
MSLKTPSIISHAVTRRTILKVAGASAAASTLPFTALAQAAVTRSHGLVGFGMLALPADYPHFPHVNLDAPKGGSLVYRPNTRAFNQSFETVNTLNGYVIQGEGPVRVELTFDTLMTATGDEVDSAYGLLAEWVEFTDDGLQYDYKLRPEARFHDGSALTASDVVWSFNTLMTDGHPLFAQSALRFVESAEVLEDDLVRYRFSPERSKTAHLSVISLPVFSESFWEGKDFGASIQEPVLGSGPYRLDDYEQNRFISYKRVEDYWAADMPFAKGLFNFDTIRINFYRDRDVAFEAFKAGEMNLRFENFSRIWATGYDFPRIQSGEVVQSTIPSEAPSGAQGLFFNTRLEKFSDWRTRQAISLAYNFEWTNQNLQFGLFERTKSMFQNAPYMAEGLPTPEELALLEPFRDELLPQVFEEPYVPPVSDATLQSDRTLLRQAAGLLREAGWQRDGERLVNDAGEQLSIEFLYLSAAFERLFTPHAQNLASLGISATTRSVDPAQLTSLANAFEYDALIQNIPPSLVPGSGLRGLIGSESANVPGTRNAAGIALPAVDALIEKVEQAETLDENYTIMRALDRVLRPYHFWLPQWYSPGDWVAHETTIKRPETKPRFALPVESHWWVEA